MTGDEGLDKLRKELREREQTLLDECAAGHLPRRYQRAVGALKEVRRALISLQDIIRKVNSGDSEDGESGSD